MHSMTQRKWVGERWIDDKATGNSTHWVIADLVSDIATKEEYPLESHVVHDMTRWKKSKKDEAAKGRAPLQAQQPPRC